MSGQTKPVHQESVDQVAKQYGTNLSDGLSSSQAQERQKTYGKNELAEPKPRPLALLFLDQFKSPLIYVLLAAAVLIFIFAHQSLDAFIILGVLFFNAIIGTIQAYRTHAIVSSLKRFFTTTALVIRDGSRTIIQAQELVPGDIVIVQEGDRIPADGRVTSVENLIVDEAMLTGEAQSVRKQVKALTPQSLGLGDQSNMLFKSTLVRSGTAAFIVTSTGLQTEVGKIQTVAATPEEIPLQKQLRQLSYGILLFVLISCFSLLAIGLSMGRPVRELASMLAALFVCVIPEGLPVVLTLTLVSGAYRMARQNVLARNLQGVEGLGRTDVIVIDKTGTLTRNELMVTELWSANQSYTVTGRGCFPQGELLKNDMPLTPAQIPESLRQLAKACVLLPTSQVVFDPKLNLFEIKGDPTEVALAVLGEKLGVTPQQTSAKFEQLYRVPFDPSVQYQAGFYKHENKIVAFVIGSPEAIFDRAQGTTQSNAQAAMKAMLANNLRIIAVATKLLPLSVEQARLLNHDKWEQKVADFIQGKLELLGLCGLQDTIRPEVAAVIQKARRAGLRIIMATGDHKQTAESIAQQVGIFKEPDKLLTGSDLKNLSDEQLLPLLNRITVYARVDPQDKLRIISLLKEQGNIVAMTGDGVNDVPSLVRADLGIAMGSIGTEVAKQASDLVLLDDSFASIINGIEEGRHIVYTLRRVTLYFFSTNLAELLIIFFALLTHFPLPLTVAQILWLNFVTDGFLDVGISLEPRESGLLESTWLKRRMQLIDWPLMCTAILMAIPMAFGAFYGFVHSYFVTGNVTYARTIGLLTLVMYQWFNAWNCRSERESLYRIGLVSNRWFLCAAAFVFCLQLALVYLPFMQYVFKTTALSLTDWGLIFALTFPILILDELRKIIVRYMS